MRGKNENESEFYARKCLSLWKQDKQELMSEFISFLNRENRHWRKYERDSYITRLTHDVFLKYMEQMFDEVDMSEDSLCREIHREFIKALRIEFDVAYDKWYEVWKQQWIKGEDKNETIL